MLSWNDFYLDRRGFKCYYYKNRDTFKLALEKPVRCKMNNIKVTKSMNPTVKHAVGFFIEVGKANR
ncbi:MAG: hypothetical protein DRP74_03135 [Candidatus Omnitrophota bacterium]|nr:MAG: hypothetical protein DRP74_03135 [Candidatus Omnitrophota bacterium]